MQTLTIRQGGSFIGGGFNQSIGVNSGFGSIVEGNGNSIQDDAAHSFVAGGGST